MMKVQRYKNHMIRKVMIIFCLLVFHWLAMGLLNHLPIHRPFRSPYFWSCRFLGNFYCCTTLCWKWLFSWEMNITMWNALLFTVTFPLVLWYCTTSLRIYWVMQMFGSTLDLQLMFPCIWHLLHLAIHIVVAVYGPLSRRHSSPATISCWSVKGQWRSHGKWTLWIDGQVQMPQ